jgi:hypothetical protein
MNTHPAPPIPLSFNEGRNMLKKIEKEIKNKHAGRRHRIKYLNIINQCTRTYPKHLTAYNQLTAVRAASAPLFPDFPPARFITCNYQNKSSQMKHS